MSACCTPNSPIQDSINQTMDASDRKQSFSWFKIGLAIFISAQSMAFGLAVNLEPPSGNARIVLHCILAVSALAVFLLLGLPLLQEAWRQLLQRKIVVEQLFLAGIIGAFFASVQSSLSGTGGIYYEVVAVLLALYTLGRMIGERRRQSTFTTVQKLRKEFETCLFLTCCGKQKVIPVEEIDPGDRVLVKTGEGIPVDGIIHEGTAFVKETSLTGEPFPVVRRPGDRVLAGSYVLDHSLTIEAKVSGKARKLDQLLHSVEQARLNPSTIQKEADRIVKWFLPFVMAISLLTFFYWGISGSWMTGVYNGLAVLLVACPCAMGLATPIGIWSGLNALASRGIVAKSGSFIEQLSQVSTVVFDKTGTLSEDELALVDFVTLQDADRLRIEQLVRLVQENSNHPVARGFASAWSELAIDPGWKVDSVNLLPGKGICATALSPAGDIHQVEIGNYGILSCSHGENEVMIRRKLMDSTNPASHEIFIKINDELVAIAILREKFRESAMEVVFRLKKENISWVVMTGDRQESISSTFLEKAEVYSALAPERKSALIRERQSRGENVLFVGDGINDAPAMTEAHASIGLVSGAGLANDVAGAQMFGSNLSTISESLLICRSVMRVIQGNLKFAAAYNTIGILVAACGFLHPVFAAVLMLVSSATVSWRAFACAERIQRSAGDAPGASFVSGEEVRNTINQQTNKQPFPAVS